MLGVLMFIVALLLLLFGFPVAFTFGGTAIFFGFVAGGRDLFLLLPERVYSIMTNVPLMAVPLFVYMGIVLQKSGLAEELLESMGRLFGRMRGGLAISTVLVGALLAATTGVVGASVVAMGVISMPVMLKYKYDKRLASGVVCASGTLGQIIPPSIILIILADVFQQPVGELFRLAVLPGLALVLGYLLFVVFYTLWKKDAAPAIVVSGGWLENLWSALFSAGPTLLLVAAVLGSIFMSVATPTESAAVGCVGSAGLCCLRRIFGGGSVWHRAFSDKERKEKGQIAEILELFWAAARETAKITAMVFTILIGATLFSLVFTYAGGDAIIEASLSFLPGGRAGFVLSAMTFIFLLGFFLDFIEIAYIVLPMLIPILHSLGLNPLWFAILVAVNLQTSFLTPPFGFSLFYLRGVVPPGVRTEDIYCGVLPFIVIQLLVLALILFFPGLFLLTDK